MCGITGFYSEKSSLDFENLKAMNTQLNHRGPDSNGLFFESNIGLGHCRLSILDLSADSNQPFASQCGRYQMVYNGEVYNYKEIAEKYDIKQKTTSDTEVILESFVINGMAAVNDFNGMFVIAIWDKKEETLYLFRDRLGIKPLFIYNIDGTIAFSSELKSLKQLPINLSIDKDAIASYLHLGYIPQPLTIYNECKKFPTGSYAIIKNGNIKIEKYWDINKKIKTASHNNEKTAKYQLNELLNESVSKRMISDVPLGTFLSGGIDSSLVSAIAQSQSDKPIKTFTIGFDDERFNEAGFAKSVSDNLKTEHYEYILTEQQALEKVFDLINIYDEPYADASAIPTLLVSQMARKEVTVCLSGDGGDELFLGYGMYTWAKRLSNPILSTFRKPIAKSLAITGNQRLKRGSFVIDYPKEKHKKSHIFSQEQYFFSRDEIKILIGKDAKVSITENYNDLARDLSPSEQQALFDIQNYLKDDLLVKVDRASMNHSLEVRVPILDHNVVEFALNLDKRLKVKNKENKYLLKQVLYDYVPKEIFDRPKRGFSIPMVKWLKNELYFFIEKYILNDEVEVLNKAYTTSLVSEFMDGKDYLANKLWSIIILNKWLNENN